MRSCVRSCGTRAELIVCGRAVCVTLFRRYLSLRSCLRSCGQVLGTPLDFRLNQGELFIAEYLGKFSEITPHENAVHVTAEYDHYCVACTTAWNERSRAILYV